MGRRFFCSYDSRVFESSRQHGAKRFSVRCGIELGVGRLEAREKNAWVLRRHLE